MESVKCPHGLLPGNCSECHSTDKKIVQMAQRKCRLLHKNGLVFDFNVQAQFDLAAVVTSIRANGFLLIPNGCYIPESEIGMMFMLQGEHQQPPAQVINFPDNPTKPAS